MNQKEIKFILKIPKDGDTLPFEVYKGGFFDLHYDTSGRLMNGKNYVCQKEADWLGISVQLSAVEKVYYVRQ